MNKKRIKVIVMIIVLTIIVFIVGLGFVGNYFYNLALNPHSDKSFMVGNPDLSDTLPELTGSEQEPSERLERDEGKQWFYAAPHEERTLISKDGLNLQGYQFMAQQPTDQWIVVVHGYTGQAALMGSDIKMFLDQGYNVLAVDLRGHGKSEGDYIGMGWHDRLDIVGWIEQIVQQQSHAQIALYGVSMGGATVMMTSGEELPSNVKAIIEDCGYTSAKDEFTYQLKRMFKLPSFPIMNAADIVTQFRAGYALGEASALQQVAKSVTPMLFIHGDQDTFVPTEMVYELYEAANVEKELLIVEGAGHAEASSSGSIYWDQVGAFLDKYFE